MCLFWNTSVSAFLQFLILISILSLWTTPGTHSTKEHHIGWNRWRNAMNSWKESKEGWNSPPPRHVMSSDDFHPRHYSRSRKTKEPSDIDQNDWRRFDFIRNGLNRLRKYPRRPPRPRPQKGRGHGFGGGDFHYWSTPPIESVRDSGSSYEIYPGAHVHDHGDIGDTIEEYYHNLANLPGFIQDYQSSYLQPPLSPDQSFKQTPIPNDNSEDHFQNYFQIQPQTYTADHKDQDDHNQHFYDSPQPAPETYGNQELPKPEPPTQPKPNQRRPQLPTHLNQESLSFRHFPQQDDNYEAESPPQDQFPDNPTYHQSVEQYEPPTQDLDEGPPSHTYRQSPNLKQFENPKHKYAGQGQRPQSPPIELPRNTAHDKHPDHQHDERPEVYKTYERPAPNAHDRRPNRPAHDERPGEHENHQRPDTPTHEQRPDPPDDDQHPGLYSNDRRPKLPIQNQRPKLLNSNPNHPDTPWSKDRPGSNENNPPLPPPKSFLRPEIFAHGQRTSPLQRPDPNDHYPPGHMLKMQLNYLSQAHVETPDPQQGQGHQVPPQYSQEPPAEQLIHEHPDPPEIKDNGPEHCNLVNGRIKSSGCKNEIGSLPTLDKTRELPQLVLNLLAPLRPKPTSPPLYPVNVNLPFFPKVQIEPIENLSLTFSNVSSSGMFLPSDADSFEKKFPHIFGEFNPFPAVHQMSTPKPRPVSTSSPKPISTSQIPTLLSLTEAVMEMNSSPAPNLNATSTSTTTTTTTETPLPESTTTVPPSTEDPGNKTVDTDLTEAVIPSSLDMSASISTEVHLDGNQKENFKRALLDELIVRLRAMETPLQARSASALGMPLVRRHGKTLDSVHSKYPMEKLRRKPTNILKSGIRKLFTA